MTRTPIGALILALACSGPSASIDASQDAGRIDGATAMAVDASLDDARPPRPDAGPSEGCGHSPAETGYIARTIEIRGAERTYELFVPPDADGIAPLPLVFVFHHAGGDIAVARGYGIQDAAAAAGDRALFVFPQALPHPAGGVGWEITCDGYDMELARAIYDAVSGEQCVDRERVFASGFSWGADMTIAFGCCLNDTVRAIAPSSGTAWGAWRDGCPSSAPALRITIGTDDGYYPVADVQGVTDHYRARNGCSETTRPSSPDPPCVAYDGCAAPVIQCVYSGMGHQIPEDGARYIWEFFASF